MIFKYTYRRRNPIRGILKKAKRERGFLRKFLKRRLRKRWVREIKIKKKGKYQLKLYNFLKKVKINNYAFGLRTKEESLIPKWKKEYREYSFKQNRVKYTFHVQEYKKNLKMFLYFNKKGISLKRINKSNSVNKYDLKIRQKIKYIKLLQNEKYKKRKWKKRREYFPILKNKKYSLTGLRIHNNLKKKLYKQKLLIFYKHYKLFKKKGMFKKLNLKNLVYKFRNNIRIYNHWYRFFLLRRKFINVSARISNWVKHKRKRKQIFFPILKLKKYAISLQGKKGFRNKFRSLNLSKFKYQKKEEIEYEKEEDILFYNQPYFFKKKRFLNFYKYFIKKDKEIIFYFSKRDKFYGGLSKNFRFFYQVKFLEEEEEEDDSIFEDEKKILDVEKEIGLQNKTVFLESKSKYETMKIENEVESFFLERKKKRKEAGLDEGDEEEEEEEEEKKITFSDMTVGEFSILNMKTFFTKNWLLTRMFVLKKNYIWDNRLFKLIDNFDDFMRLNDIKNFSFYLNKRKILYINEDKRINKFNIWKVNRTKWKFFLGGGSTKRLQKWIRRKIKKNFKKKSKIIKEFNWKNFFVKKFLNRITFGAYRILSFFADNEESCNQIKGEILWSPKAFVFSQGRVSGGHRLKFNSKTYVRQRKAIVLNCLKRNGLYLKSRLIFRKYQIRLLKVHMLWQDRYKSFLTKKFAEEFFHRYENFLFTKSNKNFLTKLNLNTYRFEETKRAFATLFPLLDLKNYGSKESRYLLLKMFRTFYLAFVCLFDSKEKRLK